MEVGMSDAVPAQLPARPNLEQLRKQAKDLRATGAHTNLATAQRAVARQYGFASWNRLKSAVDAITLRRLIEEGDADGVRRLIEASPRLARMAFGDGSTPLHVAAAENRPQVVDVLVKGGALLQTRFGQSAHNALSWAITCWSFDAAHKLVELGLTPDLFCSAGLGLLDTVKDFWRGGRLRGRPSSTGSSRCTEAGDPLPRPPKSDIDQVSDALYIACRADRLEVARWLLDHGADPNWRGYAGATCLAWAEFSANPALGALLRERGGSDEVRDYEFGATPRAFALMVLAGWGFPKLLAERLSADRSLVGVRGDRGTPLHAAAANGQAATAKILLLFGADRAATDPVGRTPADVAALKGHTALAELLRAPGAATSPS
jgi:ankyrin repeat protein